MVATAHLCWVVGTALPPSSEVLLVILAIIAIIIKSSTAPLRLRIVVISVRVDHWCFTAIVCCGSTVHWSVSIVNRATATMTIALTLLRLFRIYSLYERLINGDLLTDCWEFHSNSLVIAVANAASVSLVDSAVDNDNLANQGVSHNLVLRSNRFIWVAFDEVTAKDLNVSALLDKDSVWLHEFSIPQEQVVSISVANWANSALIRPTHNLNHLVDCQTIANFVSGLDHLARPHRRNFLTDFSRLDISNLELMIDDLQVVFMHLQNQAQLFSTIEIDQVISIISAFDPWVFGIQSCNQIGICFRFKLEVVCVDFDLLLSHVKNHRYFIVFRFDHLTCVTLVLAFDYANHIAWLKEFGNVLNVDLQRLCQWWNSNRKEGNGRVFDRNHGSC